MFSCSGLVNAARLRSAAKRWRIHTFSNGRAALPAPGFFTKSKFRLTAAL
jgi:hypothetical protein